MVSDARPPYTFTLGGLDVHDFVDVFVPAFQDDAGYRRFFPGAREDPDGAREHHIAENVRQLERNGRVGWGRVVRVDTGEGVAIGKWELCEGVEEEEHGDGEGDGEGGSGWEGADVEFAGALGRVSREYRRRIMGARRHYVIHTLATHPAHRGKGAISEVIRYLIAEGAAKHVPLYIEASPMGRPVYAHFGFEWVDTIPVDVGEGEIVDLAIMVKEP